MIYVMLPPTWLREEDESIKPLQRECTLEEALAFNEQGYNVYFYPNYPSAPTKGWVKAHEVDTFDYCFIDMDLKDGKYASKEAFIEEVQKFKLEPSCIVDTGNGIHVYWAVSDLDAMSFLRLSRRLMRKFQTDDAVQQLKQLMRVPGTVNTKNKDNFKLCETLFTSEQVYTCEQIDSALPPISHDDEEYCKEHYEKAYKIKGEVTVDDKLPLRFGKLLRDSKEAKEIWSGNVDDRSTADFRLGHIMFAQGFSKAEAMSVLVNTAKALGRAPAHRVNYAENIVEKVWAAEAPETKDDLDLSKTVEQILNAAGDSPGGTRFPCWKWMDDTEHGFRLGQVIGLVGGSGVGKTAVALNLFEGFVTLNPNYDHFFVSLEQPEGEIAARWKAMCGENDRLHRKVHIIGNYNADNTFRDLSLETIKDYIIKFQEAKNIKIGCVVIDHIGVLAKDEKYSDDDGIKSLCKQMKTFALQTNTMLIMQSQTSREKAGIGDLELNKDAAFGTSSFENFCDYLLTIWQPLKRCYDTGAPTICAFKFCKIRHKNQARDKIKEDKRYKVLFDSDTGRLRPPTQDEEKQFPFFNNRAVNARKQDRKTELVEYTSIKFDDEPTAESA